MRTNKNRFTDNVRRTLWDLQAEGNVPATKCRSVINSFKTLFDTDLDDRDLPCLQSVANIVDEAHGVATIQAAQKKLLQSGNFTLHTDGMSRGGKKIVGHQVTLDSGEQLSLGMVTVACEDTAALLDVTVSLFQKVQDVYCGWRGATEEGEEVFRELMARLTSVMTDRLLVGWLLIVPATCECISGTDLHRQFYVLPHWDRSCRSNFPSHPVTVYWHRADQSQCWPYNARRLAG